MFLHKLRIQTSCLRFLCPICVQKEKDLVISQIKFYTLISLHLRLKCYFLLFKQLTHFLLCLHSTTTAQPPSAYTALHCLLRKVCVCESVIGEKVTVSSPVFFIVNTLSNWLIIIYVLVCNMNVQGTGRWGVCKGWLGGGKGGGRKGGIWIVEAAAGWLLGWFPWQRV